MKWLPMLKLQWIGLCYRWAGRRNGVRHPHIQGRVGPFERSCKLQKQSLFEPSQILVRTIRHFHEIPDQPCVEEYFAGLTPHLPP
jgi:hypothetical protein